MSIPFSILFTTYNDEGNIKDFFDCIAAQSISPEYIIAIDGGSSDNTVECIQAQCKNIQSKLILRQGKRLNIAEGYNEGIKLCPTQHLFILGVGNFYPTDYFEKLMQCMKSTNSEIIYCPIKGVTSSKFSRTFNKAFVSVPKGELGHDFGIASNHGSLLNMDVFQKCGLFYETFIYAGEDTEFYERAKERGISIAYAKDTYLLWETPSNYKQYYKKCDVNAVADFQCNFSKQIIVTILSRIIYLIIFGTLAWVSPWLAGLWILLLIAAIVYKIKTFHVRALLLRLDFFFLQPFLYLKHLKLFKENYSVITRPYPLYQQINYEDIAL